jgi:multiple sugar transport system substrate-binding protein
MFVLVACQTVTTTTTQSSATTTSGSTTATTTTTTGTTGTTATTGTTTTTTPPDPVTITYAAWNLGTIDSNNLERLMLEAFEVQYPWITVEIIERPFVPDASGVGEVLQIWNEFLGARAAQGALPDVYFTDSTDVVITNDWAYEITDIAHADPEYMAISPDIREAANYGGHLMALPYAIYYFGYYINKTLFDTNNADHPVFEDTWGTFVSRIKEVAKQNVTDGSGIGGLFGIDRIPEWYPAQLNANLGWYTYDGEGLNLDGPEFEASLDLMWDLMQDKSFVYNALTTEELEAAGISVQAWESSKLAAYWDASWNLASMLDRDFDVDFIGTPGTSAAHQIPIVLDLMCISSQTDHPEEAYLLAKWMSFGRDGYLKRIDLSQTVEGIAALNMTPLQPSEELLNAFFSIYPTFTEFRKIISYQNYIIEPFKHVPGYASARWNAPINAQLTVGQVYDGVLAQTLVYADVKLIWNQKANDALAAARATVYEKLNINQ